MRELRITRPAEGWVTLFLVASLALIVAWAIDDPAWVFGRGALTDCLGTFALFGVAIGFLGPKLGWGRWTTHLMGALFAALLIPVFVGWTAYEGTSIWGAFNRVAYESVDAYLDLAWRRMALTDQEIHYVVVMGWIVWGTAQFSSYAVFGHRRPLAAILVMGLVLVVNMALTTREQLPYIIAFTAGSLFLLIQMHAFDERATWIRRRIGDPSSISSLYLRGGTVFIVGAMVGSMLLTTRASSAPLAGAWTGMSDRLVELGEQVSRWLPVGGAVKPLGPLSFGNVARISPVWYTDDRIAFTAIVPKAFQEERWRAATYDRFELGGWSQTEDEITPYFVNGGEPLLDVTSEKPAPDLSEDVTVTVQPANYRESLLVVPGAPLTVDRGANVLLFGEGGWFAGVSLPGDSGATYTADAAVPLIETDKGVTAEGITEEGLRAAGTTYPRAVSDLYTDVPDGAIGPNAEALLEDLKSRSPSQNPFDLAKTMQTILHSNAFKYDTNLTNVSCEPSAVECFARIKRGYCLHYASTMAILLRAANPDNPIPTRLVQGFLPGEANGNTTTVRIRDAHAWVEVYFPGYGWIPFDPTGQVGRPETFPVGKPVPSASFPNLNSFDPTRDQEGPSRRPTVTAPTTPNGPGGPDGRVLLAIFATIAVLIVLVVAATRLVRGSRGEVSPDAAWRSMARIASRFGVAPRPTQTVYEYAATLGDLVPVAQRDIQVVATAKVESAYAGLKLGGARLDALRDASRRLRLQLVRLAFRRPRRRRRRS